MRNLVAVGLVAIASVAIAVGVPGGRGKLITRPKCRPNMVGKVFVVEDCGSVSCADGGGTVQCDLICLGGNTYEWRTTVCLTAAGVMTVNATTSTSTSSSTTTSSSTSSTTSTSTSSTTSTTT